jgi:hypothetical protein
MSEGLPDHAPELAGSNPFSPRAALALVLFGAIVFIALLWMIGTGMTGGSTNDGGDHAGGKGLNGYAALAGYLERRGMTVRRSQGEAAYAQPALLVLTPPHGADPKVIDRIVASRHLVGPTIVVVPKWLAAPVPAQMAGGKDGWVQIAGPLEVSWPGFRDDVSLDLAQSKRRDGAGWQAEGLSGPLPDGRAVQSGSGRMLVPLVVSRSDGRMLAGYIDDGGIYPGLEDMALGGPSGDADNEDTYPLVMVFEPDLLNNYGMASQNNARLAERLIRAAGGGAGPVTFDLTLNGHSRSANLLTLAFTPPFLAATLCLLIAAAVAGWRAFLRFGPPRVAGRAIAFGKTQLVANAAGLIRRSGRLHLVTGTYAAAARERLARSLALPRMADAAATEAAIDRALAARAPDAAPFSQIAGRLRAARRAPDIVRAAQDLHALERTLLR